MRAKDKYLVIETSVATSRVFKKDDEGRYYHWYTNEDKWHWVSTHHWGNLDKGTVLFETDDFNEILPFLRSDVKNRIEDVRLDVEMDIGNVVNKKNLNNMLDMVEKMSTSSIKECINVIESLTNVAGIIGRTMAIESAVIRLTSELEEKLK